MFALYAFVFVFVCVCGCMCVCVCVYASAHACVHHIKEDNDVNTTHTNKEPVKTSQGNWDKSHFHH